MHHVFVSYSQQSYINTLFLVLVLVLLLQCPFLYHLSRCEGNFYEIHIKTHSTRGAPLTFGQNSTEASSGENTGQNMERNIKFAHAKE